MKSISSVLVTGGAGYLGSVLVPKLLDKGYQVTVLDHFFFGRKPLAPVVNYPSLTCVESDIRDTQRLKDVFEEGRFDAVIHLAAISNDPSSKLDAELTKSVNRDAMESVMRLAKRNGVSRFLYASSASVYGIKDTPDVTEDLSLHPITLYAKYKAEGEDILNELADDEFCGVSVRAATVCGWSPRLRLDLTINILTSHALQRGEIRVFGGNQMRPNIHIEDLTDFYVMLLEADREAINAKAFNVSAENASVMSLAKMIQEIIDESIPIKVEPTDDNRSYHLSATRAQVELGFVPSHDLDNAVLDLKQAYEDGRMENYDHPIYHNVKLMKQQPAFWKDEVPN